MTLEEKYKKLLELVQKYDKFAEEIKIEYICEIECSHFILFPKTKERIIQEVKDEFNALRAELRRIEND